MADALFVEPTKTYSNITNTTFDPVLSVSRAWSVSDILSQNYIRITWQVLKNNPDLPVYLQLELWPLYNFKSFLSDCDAKSGMIPISACKSTAYLK